MNATANEAELMSLAPGVGVVPEKYRNRGYDKLTFGPGEGGLGMAATQKPPADDRMDSFLVGVAAGADPKLMAKEMLDASGGKPARRNRAS